ncbi:hypothetical protein EJ06DRAFT_143743 [Trichodelitschia bisporula]|uniref:Uncharacterized protein n=1 Tax=Trichodelitschia bisporula TaxID=703511 RepID=A0A6G1HQA7_9PEZI|nr:hypothetical protein EJ06DRAFT_143743 [Trichodelitschia bisporula]
MLPPSLRFSPGEFPLVLLLGLGDSVSLEIGCRWSGCAPRCRDQLQLLLDRPRIPLRCCHSPPTGLEAPSSPALSNPTAEGESLADLVHFPSAFRLSSISKLSNRAS